MNNYKVGDRVWIDGDKFMLIDVNYSHPLDLDIEGINELDNNHRVAFSSVDSGGIKPILKVKNGVVCE